MDIAELIALSLTDWYSMKYMSANTQPQQWGDKRLRDIRFIKKRLRYPLTARSIFYSFLFDLWKNFFYHIWCLKELIAKNILLVYIINFIK